MALYNVSKIEHSCHPLLITETYYFRPLLSNEITMTTILLSQYSVVLKILELSCTSGAGLARPPIDGLHLPHPNTIHIDLRSRATYGRSGSRNLYVGTLTLSPPLTPIPQGRHLRSHRVVNIKQRSDLERPIRQCSIITYIRGVFILAILKIIKRAETLTHSTILRISSWARGKQHTKKNAGLGLFSEVPYQILVAFSLSRNKPM